MSLGPVHVRSSLLALALGAASPALAAIDLVGATQATFTWQPASGPVSGYVVYQLCDANGQTLKSSVATNRATFTPQACNAFSVQVAAFGVGGQAQTGPLSDPSDLLRFLPTAPAPEPTPPPASPSEPTPETPPGAGGPGAAASGTDFDADGRAEVLLHHPSDGALLLSTLAGSQLVAAASLPAFPPGARVVGNGDYDGDGHPDLLGLDGRQLFVWLMRGASPVGVGTLGEPLPAGSSLEGSGDFDGDGVSDLLIRRPELGRVEVWSLRGGAIEAVDALAGDPGGDWRIIGAGDHDGDGRADVLWNDARTGELVLWRSLARGSFETVALSSSLKGRMQVVAVADFDGDGRDDVLWRRPLMGVLLLSSFPAGADVQTQRLGVELPAPLREVVGTGDFDGDGHLDVLVRNRDEPMLTLWRMRGAERLSGAAIGELAPGWTPAGHAAESPSTQRWIF